MLLATLLFALGALTSFCVSLAIQLWSPPWADRYDFKRLIAEIEDDLKRNPSPFPANGRIIDPRPKEVSPRTREWGQSYDAYLSAGRMKHLATASPSPLDDTPAWIVRESNLALAAHEHRIRQARQREAEGKPADPSGATAEQMDNDFFGAMIEGFGWPMVATSRYMVFPAVFDPATQPTPLTNGVTLSPRERSFLRSESDVLAISPVWPGFLVNTLFFASIYALLAIGPFVLIRRRRLKRNHCCNCNYNLAGLATGAACPECGTSAPHSASPALPPRS